MKILHVGLTNIAGVPGLLVKGLRQKGIEADLVVYERHPFGFPEEFVQGFVPNRILLVLDK